jgi:hypothetical protein
MSSSARKVVVAYENPRATPVMRIEDVRIDPHGMRPTSLDVVRLQRGTNTTMRPVVIEVYPNEKPFLADGRHRVQVAQERGDPSVEATVRTYGPRGALRSERRTQLLIVPASPHAPCGASCPPPALVAPQPNSAPPAEACGPFTKVVRDEARYNACRARALALGSLTTPQSIFALIGPDLKNETNEVFVVVGLDVNGVLLSYDEVARGQVDHVAVAPGDILGVVLINRCKAFVVAHNHPSGDARPSDDDKTLTKKLRQAAAAFPGVVMLDHLIVGDNEFYSFAEGGKVSKARAK